jgi:5'-nucleotidase
MEILVTNDDGINSEGLWMLVKELKKIAGVTVVTPDSERSAIGTALSLFESLQVEEVKPAVSGVTAYTVDGTPADCVVLALGKLVKHRIDLVVSGINLGSNVGEDVYISGTVGAALQGYFRGSSAMAVSAPRISTYALETAARTAALLAGRIDAASLTSRIFFNVNVPDLPPADISGARITRLARTSHINTVEEDDRARRNHYRLVRQQIGEAAEKGTDMYAIKHGIISITPLFTSLFERPPQHFLKSLYTGLVEEMKTS